MNMKKLTAKKLFRVLENRYSRITPVVDEIGKLFDYRCEVISNDHIAFRTVNDERVGVDKLSKVFLELGYVEGGEYHFEEKKLYAKHFYHPTEDLPKVFISELLLEEFSDELRDTMLNILDEVDFNSLDALSLITGGRLWGLPNYNTYLSLIEESEYAGWFYLYGYVTNHFTVDVNKLESFNSLKEVNDYLMDSNIEMNGFGGYIKGGKDVYLEQSSTMADRILYRFEDGFYKVPSCFYEFAYRHPMENGELFQGFVASSANKIFESTNMK